MNSKAYISVMIERSRKAQKVFEGFDQQQVDNVVKEIAKVVYDNAEELARMAVEETRMGVYEDKVKKNRGKPSIIWNSIKNKKSVGIISHNEETGIIEVAKPMGVIGLVTPCTNPVVTPMCNAMFALKGRNSVIISPHPRAKKCTRYIVDLFNNAIKKYNVPEDLIQTIDEPSIELTNELMKNVDVVVATGGMGMVKSAYSSGKPSYGVGAGNVQCIIDRDVDFKEAVPKIIAGRIFDNGIICSGEQSIIIHEDNYDEIISEFKENGAYYTEDKSEVDAIRSALFPNGAMNKNLAGQSIQKVADVAGITIPEGTKVILAKAEGIGEADALGEEKMCSVIAVYKYKTFKEAVDIANANLDVTGKGHSISLHSYNKENIEYAGKNIPVCRVLLNQVCATMNGGSFFNGLTPTTTLGCGSWGNNSISENLDYKHLINITRIAHYMKDAIVPTDEELWG
ncbi:MAG TPA: succinate-semialdehyde dehydrogenase [Clostridiales bacterium]|nr:aldehyde dehydrogenase family protein [Clostridia bacterium]HCS73307.1 succinate-semialdehyde dehydrogenase [Clostridiales bacterium]